MSYATSPDGPWSKPRHVPTKADTKGDSNFAGIIKADSSVLAVGRHTIHKCAHWNKTETCTYEKAKGMKGEDPFIWYDPRNNATKPANVSSVLHMLRHTHRDTKNWTGNNGAHQFSLDEGKTWNIFGKQMIARLTHVTFLSFMVLCSFCVLHRHERRLPMPCGVRRWHEPIVHDARAPAPCVCR
jgi:hypothetical protein